MIKTTRHTKRFLSNNDEDLAAYDSILNDPMCTVIREHKEKIKEVDYDGDSSSQREWIEYLVTWEQKEFI